MVAATAVAACWCAAFTGSAGADVERHALPDVDALAYSLQFEPDGDLRFFSTGGQSPSRIGRLTPGGALSFIDPGFFGFGQRTDMARASDGALWAAELYGDGLDRLDPDGTVSSETFDQALFSEVATGPDGAVYAATHREGVSRLGVREDGSSEEQGFDGPAESAPGNSAYDLAFLNGRIYLMGNARCTTAEDPCEPARLIEVDPAAAPGEQRRETPIPALDYLTNFEHIVAGPDGRLWVQDQARPRTVHRFTPAGADAPLTLPAGARLAELAPGSNGAVVARTDVGAVARIRPDGTVREWCPLNPDLVTRGAGHDYLLEAVAGAEGAIWFSSRGEIGQVTLDTAPLGGCAPQAGATSADIGEFGVTLRADVVRGGGRLPQDPAGGFDAPDPEIPGHGVRFEIGTTTAYGRTIPVLEYGGEEHRTYLDDLEPGTTYHARIVATTRFGTAAGPDTTFTTPGPPAVAVTGERILDGFPAVDTTIDPLGSDTSVEIEYGPTAALGTILFVKRLGAAAGGQPLTIHMTGGAYDLRTQPEFHYRILATSARGTTRTETRMIQVPQPRPPSGDGGPGTGQQTGSPSGQPFVAPPPTRSELPAPPPPPVPTVDQTGPALRVPAAGAVLRATKAGVVRIAVGPVDEDTTGVLGLKTAGKVRPAPGRRRRVVALGTAAFQALDGQKVAVRVKLSKANRRLLRRAGKLRVRATFTVRDLAGNATVGTRVFTVRRGSR